MLVSFSFGTLTVAGWAVVVDELLLSSVSVLFRRSWLSLILTFNISSSVATPSAPSRVDSN